MRARLIIAHGREAAILRRHPWVFSGAVKRVDGKPDNGDMVDVVAADGAWLAAGHYQSGESIVCKVLTFDADENRLTEEELLRRRIQSAVAYRRRLGFFDLPDTNVFRLVHAEGDSLPGLVCDWYNGVLVMQAHSVGMHRRFPMLAAIFRELLGDSLVAIFDKSSNTLRVESGERRVESGERRTESGERRVESGEWRVESGERRVESGERRVESGERRTESGERRTESGEWRVESGERRTESGELRVENTDGFIYTLNSQFSILNSGEWEIIESGNRLLINFYEGQKTGFFIDQRENRALVQQLARGHRVLNCFGYTGGFSLAALRGGADYVETVDISRKAIELCNRNVALNFGPDAPHQGTVADVLQYLSGKMKVESGKIEAEQSSFNVPLSTFDFIILDPPAFAKNHHVLKQGLKGYRTINQRAMEMIQPGGLLMTFSCSQAVSVEDFRTMVFTAAANAHRRVRIVRVLPHAMDHPVSVYHPEGEYLKGLLLEVE